MNLLQYLNPFHNEVSVQRKFIFYVSLYFIFIPLYKFYSDYEFITYYYDFTPKQRNQMFMYYFPYLIYFIGGIFFISHKKTGWIMITGSIIITLEFTLLISLKFGLTASDDAGWNLVSQIITGYFLVSFIMVSTVLYILFTKGITSIFSIGESDKVKTIIGSSIITAYLYIKMMY